MIKIFAGVRLTHVPTGLTAYIREDGRYCNPRAKTHERARSLLAAKLAKLKEDPEWVEGKSKRRVRSWHFHTYLGVEQFVKNEPTGTRFALTYDMHHWGQIDHLLSDLHQ